MTNFETTMKEIAEEYIVESRRDELHTCEYQYDFCIGCSMMSHALELLSFIGDTSVY